VNPHKWQAVAAARLAFAVGECLPAVDPRNGLKGTVDAPTDAIGSPWLRVSRPAGIELPPKNGPLHDVSKHTLRPACGLSTRCATSTPATENSHGQRGSVAKAWPSCPRCQVGTQEARPTSRRTAGISLAPERAVRAAGQRPSRPTTRPAVAAEATHSSRATAERRMSAGVAAGYATSQIADPVALG
jgi:hypothetical protein